jgi:AcrR family transcriptional regulator
VAKPTAQPVPRKPRADAQRNRERILAVAKEAFTRLGADASLDEIAREAGVGPGTLYRHFPTRDALLEAVFRTEVEKLAAAAVRFAETLKPVDALRAWMLLFIDYVEAKHLIAPALKSVGGGPEKLYERNRAPIGQAMEALVKRGIESGDLRPDVVPFDLMRALVGVAYTASGVGWQESARRLVEILIAGARVG